jgi:hypothetical protein
MTAKEKAIELIEKFMDKMFYLRDGYNSTEIFDTAKQCALLAADEVLGWMGADRGTEFWQEVKREIQEL